MPWAALVFDEAHYLKNQTSARSKLARELTARASTNAGQPLAVQLLTGTPLTSRPRDLFVLLQLVGHPLGRSFLAFARRYCAAEKGEFGWKTGGASNIDELTVQLHGVMLRRSKDEVLSLPPKLRTWLPVEVPRHRFAGDQEGPDASQWKARRRSRRHASGKGRAKTRTAAGVHHRGTAGLGSRQDVRDARLHQGCNRSGQKVVVFSCFDDPIQKLAKELGSDAVVLTGKTPGADRQGLVDRFQEDESVRVFLANIIAGGTGLNLTAATQVVFNDLDWVPTNHWQAEDRAYRIGQTRTVNVTYFVARNTVDDFVQTVLETKAALVNAIVEGEAMAHGLGGDVLDELQRALHSLSSGVVDAPDGTPDDELLTRLLKQASEEFRGSHQIDPQRATVRTATEVEAFKRALEGYSRCCPVQRRSASGSRAPRIRGRVRNRRCRR